MTVIESLEIKNFQRVSAVKIEPSNNIVALFGQNAQGKTSILDALETSMTGYNSKFTKRPIKEGAGRADIEITLTDGSKIHRKFTPSGSTLAAADGDGTKWGQRDLDAALSALGVDARAFIHKGPKEQLDLLLSIVELDIDPAALDAETKQVEDARRLVGQQGKAIGDVTVEETLPTVERSATELIEQIRTKQTQMRERESQEDLVSGYRNRVEELQTELQHAETDLALAEDRLNSLPPAIDPGEVTALEESLTTLEDSNARIRTNNAAIEQAQRKDELRAQYEAHTARLDQIKADKAAGLAKAVMPVEGLSFDAEGVLYQGVPFSRASGSEALIVSLAMIIATNPAIRTAVIRDGNVLDARSLGIIQEMCEATDFQVFIEFVSDAEDHEYRIVDGELA